MPAPTTTAQRVFDIAMGLMDEVNESSGATDTSDTREYKVRTLLILNALRGELYPYSDTYEHVEPNKRPIVSVIQSFDQIIDMDDYICQSVMPYGLAAHLLLDENPDTSAFLMRRYEAMREDLKSGFPVESESITDVYNAGSYFPHNEFGRWG